MVLLTDKVMSSVKLEPSTVKVLVEPSENASTTYQLHEGTKAKVTAENSNWYEISFNEKKDNLERQLIDIRLKLKEANLSLDTQNIKNLNSDFGREAKNLLASNLAKGVPEETIVNTLRLLGNNKICSSYQFKELPVSTQSFTPPRSILLLLSGSLKIKAEGNINDKSNDNPYFNPIKPLRITFIYFGNNDLVEGDLPISKNILAGKFSVKIKVLKSKVRGVVIVRYQTCKVS